MVQSTAYSKELTHMFGDRVSCISAPLLEISSIGEVPDFAGVQAVLFTSANGVRELAKIQPVMPNIPYLCVGDKTAIEARNMGLEAFSAKGGADELVQLAPTILAPKNGPILYIRGKIAAGEIAKKLSRQGFDVVEHVMYEQVPLSLTDTARSLLASAKTDILPLFSSLTAKLLAAELHAHPEWRLDNIDAICLSAKIREHADGLAFRSLSVVDTPTASSMTAAIGSCLRE